MKKILKNRFNATFIGLLFTTFSEQSILQDYFKGNRDSLIAEATRLINLPEPTLTSTQNIPIYIKRNGL